MIDNPMQAERVLKTLHAALPFDVSITPEMTAQLAEHSEKPLVVVGPQPVVQVSYLGDEGGIMCHIKPKGTDANVVLSLTHVRMHASLPFAEAVKAYQKHRVKKIAAQVKR